MATLHNIISEFKAHFVNLDSISDADLCAGNIPNQGDNHWKLFERNYRRHAGDQNQNFLDKTNDFKNSIQFSTFPPQQLLSILRAEIQTFFQPAILRLAGDQLIFTQPVVILSKCLSEIYGRLQDPLIQTVRIEAKYYFFIDASIEQHQWRGRNLQITSKVINCVTDYFHWDLSGDSADYDPQGKANDAIIPGRNGFDGENGAPGKNGGNLTLNAEVYQNIDTLFIQSNGGNGGHGEHGGNGCNGVDGRDGNSMSQSEFERLFPPPVSRLGVNRENLKTCMHTLRSQCQNWNPTLNGFDDQGNYNNDWISSRHILCQGLLTTGVSYEIHFTEWNLGSSYCTLLKGEQGTYGGVGGTGGRGGAAGRPGKAGRVVLLTGGNNPYAVQQLRIEAKDGNVGKNGNYGISGRSGKHGTHGGDLGMMGHWSSCKTLVFGLIAAGTVASPSAGLVWGAITTAFYYNDESGKILKDKKYRLVPIKDGEICMCAWSGARNAYLKFAEV